MPNWWFYLPTVAWGVWVFVLGLVVGSFLNVVIARLPYEKSIVWPGSRCFSCLQPIRLLDNLPVVGYLRLGGRCRACGAGFSARYLWVEVGTAVAFLLLFVVDVLSQAADLPDGLKFWQAAGPKFAYRLGAGPGVGPPWQAWALFALHAALLSLFIAAAAIDAGHRVIPAQITYPGTLLGLAGATLFPWPWPADPGAGLPAGLLGWVLGPPLPTGATLWPFAGPPPGWAPPGSHLLGLVNGLVGAAAGMAVGRSVKFLFEVGMGKEALGLGDADLLMMAGAFLGWQPAVMALPVGAVAALVVILPGKAWDWARGRSVGAELPFGPGLAAGVVLVWWGWPWVGEAARVTFDPILLAATAVLTGGFMLAAGVVLRRR